MAKEIFIISAQRTPIGGYLGALASLTAPELGARAISATLSRAKLAPDAIDEVFFGNVLSAGIGQAPARQAALKAGIPASVPTTTVSKVCGSGLQALILAARAIQLGEMETAIAGGMESMSQVPYYVMRARTGYRMGDATLVDGMVFDGLHDPYNDFHMGVAAELCADKYDLTREIQDEFARESYQRARAAQEKGYFKDELAAVSVPQRKGPALEIKEDEGPGRADLGRFSGLKPAFKPDGTITAANASSINDGAAAVLLAGSEAVRRFRLEPLARILGSAAAAQAPEWFTTAPVLASQRLLHKLGLKPDDIDLWEINEAFSCVTLACSRLLSLEPARVNVHGGAVALGHPIGATGARLVTTLSHALVRQGARRGVAAICIGGGEGLAFAIERL